MRFFLLCAALAASSSYGAGPTCGCNYSVLDCPGCDASKLKVMLTGSKTCVLGCERGWQLESKQDAYTYVECLNGEKFKGNKRNYLSTAVMNPIISCSPTAPQTCPEGSYSTYDCENCDPSKIMVVPRGESICTIECDRGYQLREKNQPRPLAEATLNIFEKNRRWNIYALKWLSSGGAIPDVGVAFTCEAMPGTVLATTTTITTSAPIQAACPTPPEVPTSEFPVPWIRGANIRLWNDGTYNWVECPDGFIGKMGDGSKSVSFGSAYRCDEASRKWIFPGDKNYEAPGYLSCGVVPAGSPITYCGISNKQSNGAVGLISIYPGFEQYCPTGQVLQFGDGKSIKSIKCSGSGLTIEDFTGDISNPVNPTLQCVPAIKPCTCKFSDSGAALGMTAPSSFCTSSGLQKLQCEGSIYVKDGDSTTPFDQVTCSEGNWYGTECGGAQSALNTASVSVQCGSQEPPFCPQLPSRGGLKYIGTENGLQRYTCPGDQMARLVVFGDRTVHAKYIECTATAWRAVSSNGAIFSDQKTKVEDFSCRDTGKIDKACSVPELTNAYMQDGVVRCQKGFYVARLGFFNGNTKGVTLQSTAFPLVTARCEASGWKIDGTIYTGVQLTAFLCSETPLSAANCGALSIAYRNVNYSPIGFQYSCWDADAEQMEVVTPSATYYGFKLQCVAGEWKFTGVDTVTIPPKSKVSCKPNQMGALPLLNGTLPLIPEGKTPEGLMRWTCMEGPVTLELASETDSGRTLTIQTPFFDASTSTFRYYSNDGKTGNDLTTSGLNLTRISCTDIVKKDRCANYRQVEEPTLPSQLLSRNGLQYIGIWNDGMKRYGCGDGQIVRAKIDYYAGPYIADGKWVEWNAQTYRVMSSTGTYQSTGPILETTCRDIGSMNKVCSTPWDNNALLKDGVIQCDKGCYIGELQYFDASNTLQTVAHNQIRMVTATCGSDGWTIPGTSISGVRLASVWCWGAPDKAGDCLPLNITKSNVEFDSIGNYYYCRDRDAEKLSVTTKTGQLYKEDRATLTCRNGQWAYGYTAGTTITLTMLNVEFSRDAKVVCEPEPTFPSQIPSRNGLQYISTLKDGMKRYGCADGQIVRVKVDYYAGPYNADGKWIECDEKICRVTSSTEIYQTAEKILEVTCLDIGSTNKVCSIPWDNNALLKDGVIQCDKGCYIGELKYFDASNTLQTVAHNQMKMVTATCGSDGWTIPGTSVSGVRLASVWCWGTPDKIGSCVPLKMTKSNVEFDSSSTENYYYCRSDAEKLTITISNGEIFKKDRATLRCRNNVWLYLYPGGSTTFADDHSRDAKVVCEP